MGTIHLSVAFNPLPYAEAICRARRLGFRSVILRYTSERDSEDYHSVKRLAESQGVDLPMINGYANLIHPDPERLALEQRVFVGSMEAALKLGAGWANTMIGTRDPALSFWEYHPDNFSPGAWECAVESIRTILERCPDDRIGVTLEPYLLTTLSSSAHLLRMIEEVGSARVKVLFEPVNLIGPNEYWRQPEVLTEMIGQLGSMIVGVHAKDHYLHRRKATLHIEERVPGRGEFDYPTLLRRLAELPGEPLLIVEHLREDAEILEAKGHITSIAERCGVTLI